MNGFSKRWTVILKVILVFWTVAIAPAVPVGAWVVKSTILNNDFREKGERWTDSDGERLRAELFRIASDLRSESHTMVEELERRILEKIALLPPEPWAKRIESVDKEVRENSIKIERGIVIMERIEDTLKQDGG
jgi:hypothetical protein